MSKRIDLLDRDKFVENVITLVNQLSKNKKGCCFAVEGGWGIGKTFVIEEIEEQLRVIQSEETNGDKYFVFHYNCWEYDYYEEPSVAIISAMFDSMQDVIGDIKVESMVKNGWENVKSILEEIVSLYIENKIGVNPIGLFEKVDKISSNQKQLVDEFDKMFSFSQTMVKVRENLKKIAEERTIVLIVDELDRCIPQYAIKVLERLHHIFNGLENVVLIMAVDRKQLEHSVEEMFGSRTDGTSIDIEKYLKKFIDFSMILDNGIVNQSFKDKYQFYYDRFSISKDSKDEYIINEVLQKLFKGIDIRRQEKIIEKANIVHSIVCSESEEVDISVMLFEIMYEVLQLMKFGDMSYVVRINGRSNEDLEKQIGKEKIKFLQSMEKQAYLKNEDNSFNLYGKVFWYFANIFYKANVPYTVEMEHEEELKNQLDIAEKYCEFCENN